MSHFQVTATLVSGATVSFGVASGAGAPGALLAAYVRLSWFGQVAEHLEVTPLRDGLAARLAARPAAPETGR